MQNLEIDSIYRVKDSKSFSMRGKIRILAIGKTHAFVRVIQPICWGLDNTETTLSLKRIEKEYVKYDWGVFNSNGFYKED